MAKFYSKSDLQFVNGYVIDPETKEAVALPDKVAEQLNDYETTVQKAAYMAGQDEARPEPSLEGFERESIRNRRACVEFDTPLLDAKKKESMEILGEIRNKEAADGVNKILGGYPEMIEFLGSDTFVEGGKVVMVDTPTLGSPIELTVEGAIRALADVTLGADNFVGTRDEEE